ncbi:MAG: hypothetical protein WCE30_06175 [Mycobacterium sp.]
MDTTTSFGPGAELVVLLEADSDDVPPHAVADTNIATDSATDVTRALTTTPS